MNATSGSHAREIAFGDLERELATTRRVLERLPEEHFAWKPHEKSMHLSRLAMHVATLPQWMLTTIEQDGLDMASPPKIPNDAKSRDQLLATFDQGAADVIKVLAKADDATLGRTWTVRNGQQVLHSDTKAKILRVWCLNHMIHHRAQLCVYLRLLNVPVPAVYFNSADEPQWVFT